MAVDGRYASYMVKEKANADAFRRDEGLVLPANLDYNQLGSVSAEAKELLIKHRPATLGAAARINGVTPPVLMVLLKHVRKYQKPQLGFV